MNSVNFLPQTYVRQRARRGRRYRQAMLIALAVLCLLGWWAGQRSQTQSLRRHAVSLEAQAYTTEAQVAELQRLRQEQRSLIRQVDLQRELAQPVNHTQVLATLGAVLPQSVTLVDMKMRTRRPDPAPRAAPDESRRSTTPRNTPAAPQPDRIEIEMTGVAPDDRTVASVIGLLDAHPLFRAVMLRSSRAATVGGVDARQFRLTMVVDLARQYRPTHEAEVARAH
jgi:Tfp pilus assembly protein PilN